MPQRVLSYQLSEELSQGGITALGGLPLYLDLAHILRLGQSIEKHVNVREGGQGYTDFQFIVPLILMNLAGGDCVADLEKLEDDHGFRRLYEKIGLSHLSRTERRLLKKRWRKKNTRLIPSASSYFRFLERFCTDEETKERVKGEAYIPPLSDGLVGLQRVNQDMLASIQSKTPQKHATIDLDATLKAVDKKEALFSYKGFRSYQPLNVWWDEADFVVLSEFRDGNVPASFENLRVTIEALDMLPEGVETVSFRSDTAAYQIELLQYFAKGGNSRFGIIEFAIGAPLSPALKEAIKDVPEGDWKQLQVQDKKTKEWVDTAYEYAEVVFVPNWVATSKKNPEYRFIATRKSLGQQLLPEVSELFEMEEDVESVNGSRYKLYAMVTNKTEPGDEIIRWYRKRCGKSEQVHDAMKNDLAGGQLPSGKFGANAAWWAIMILALNLNSAMKKLVLVPALGKEWAKKRLKAIRYSVINLPGRIVNHARELWVKLGGTTALSRLRDIRTRIAALA